MYCDSRRLGEMTESCCQSSAARAWVCRAEGQLHQFTSCSWHGSIQLQKQQGTRNPSAALPFQGLFPCTALQGSAMPSSLVLL